MAQSRSDIRAVVFDFDGVILESADIKTRAFAALFAEYPEHQDAIVRMHLENAGISRYRKFEWIYRDLLDRPLPESEMARLDAAFSQLVTDQILACDFVPGARECLERLSAEQQLFIASGTPQDELRSIVEQRGLTPYFVAVYGSPASKAEILAQILRTQELTPTELVFVGDALSDYDGAREAGVFFVGRIPPGSDDPFPAAQVLARIGDLGELERRWESVVRSAQGSPR
jgi:HAD superfamily hydrolase (TIGR01549 family)